MPDKPEIKLTTLNQMRSRQKGKITEIQGGHGLINRLNALGIRPGNQITKVSSMLMRGPVTAQVNSTRIAIGFGMAKKIIVETEEKRG
ncbi:ferrous iron transport protein A [Chloroflexota bacterium]